ncbi:unnamed protein product [Linum tenue]|uniref:glucan endo-1,3-beta-D-glucosidase n=1 Tax=Linum tenue TaxID=586396 RepID=A0AAV0M9M9_9ROSI|nr:unnamed protein product [Linum tenue]
MDALLKLPSRPFFLPLLLLSLSSILSAPTTASSAVIGVTYRSPPPSPPSSTGPEAIAYAVSALGFGAVRLPFPDPDLIRALTFTNASLFLSIPNSLLPSLASNRSLGVHWIRVHVLPFYPRSRFAVISVGDAVSQLELLLPAIRNVHLALQDLGIKDIPVSTTFSFLDVVIRPVPPSLAAFREPMGEQLIHPLLRFLKRTNSKFLVTLQPYTANQLYFQMPRHLALFQGGGELSFDHNYGTESEYHSLFEMMLDAVYNCLKRAGYESMAVVVAGTGWPSSAVDEDGIAESDANTAYAQVYLKSLIAFSGSDKRRPGCNLEEVYIDELMDAQSESKQRGTQQWGVLDSNLSSKYSVFGSLFDSVNPYPPSDEEVGEGPWFARIWKLICLVLIYVFVRKQLIVCVRLVVPERPGRWIVSQFGWNLGWQFGWGRLQFDGGQ